MQSEKQAPFRLDGRIAIVTGSGRGIGRAIAKVFARAGATIVVGTRTASSGKDTVAAIEEEGGAAVLETVDLGSRTACETLISSVAARFGKIDIIVHNAAFFPIIPIDEMTEDKLDETLNVNLKAAFWLTKAALPQLRAAPSPRLLFTSSVTGPRVALPGLAHYAASKSGLNGFIRTAAMEFARDAITVNGVEPGLIHTDAVDVLGDSAHIAAMARAIPLKRLGTPEEIAYAMLYLASDQAAFVTGQTIIVDGGALIPENSAAWE